MKNQIWALCVAATVLLAAPVCALAVTYDFIATAKGEGSYAGESYLGSFTYDENDPFILNSGTEYLDPFIGSLSITFDFEGQLFTEMNDADYDWFPVLTLVDGIPFELSYLLLDGFSGVDFTDPSVVSVSLIGALVPVAEGPGFTMDTFVALNSQVPEPATLAIFGLGLAALGATRRKKLAA